MVSCAVFDTESTVHFMEEQKLVIVASALGSPPLLGIAR